MKILIVEDSKTQAEQLKKLLEDNGYKTFVAENGQEAMDKLHSIKPVLIMSDIMMPIMSGYELCKRVRQDPEFKNIPFILLTTLSDAEDIVSGLESGANYIIIKPYDSNYLLKHLYDITKTLNVPSIELDSKNVKLMINGHEHIITAEKPQILNLLISIYDAAIQKSRELNIARLQLQQLNNILEDKVTERTAALRLEFYMRIKAENALYYDSLTGLPTRILLLDRLNQAIETHRHPNQIAAISVRINRLQELENSFGSEASDYIIQEASKRLKILFDKSDITSRLENDCFVILMTFPERSSTLLTKLNDIFKIFELPFIVDKKEHFFGCNIGVSLFPGDSDNANKLLNNALYAMHLQSTDSKFPYRFYSDESTKKLSLQFELETLLIEAIKLGKLELFYQPKVDIATGVICGAEALCRWNDAIHGSISPLEFISIAEQSELIVQLGEWTLRQVCKQNKEWQDRGLRKIPISVNVSKKQLLKKSFHEDVKRILAETNLGVNYLDLEITESLLVNMDDLLENIKRINERGVSLTLDDFGTGYSSLSYVQQLPLSALKVDKSFITNMFLNERNASMVRTIVAMSKTLGLICIAEGVETPEQLSVLRSYQCDQIQGYLFSKPLPADQFAQLLLDDVRLE